MTARARRTGETFKAYRRNLIAEDAPKPKVYLCKHTIINAGGSGAPVLLEVIGNTYNVGNNKQKREKREARARQRMSRECLSNV